ncbi:MAG: hypothetical protein IKG72_04805 [Bacillus sp. (in: Bacteria)]|nr:hypothetical protein [Bacillus sp. (in: firmicutes)]
MTEPKQGKRVFFTEDDRAVDVPDMAIHQKKSWEDFTENGLQEVFDELNPIDGYTGQKFSLRFKEYKFKDSHET